MNTRVTLTGVVTIAAAILQGSWSMASAQASQEGIKVRGHWVIDVRNPDGTLAHRTAFDNHLLASGQAHLQQLLAGEIAAGPSGVGLHVAGNTSVWMIGETERVQTFAISTLFAQSLVVTNGPNGLTWSGSITANRDGSLVRVFTYGSACVPSVSPASCKLPGTGLAGQYALTEVVLPAPVSIGNGQIVQVRVTFTFSAASPDSGSQSGG